MQQCFAKVKVNLNGELSDAVHENLKLAVMDAVDKITPTDMAGYRATFYMSPN